MQPMANIALRAARKAADFLARSMDRPDQFQIQEKRRNDFVSNIDRTAEAIIIEQIRETYPNHRILAEESGEQAGDSEFTWVIDPLDGTLNYLQGIPHFAVSIGIMKGNHHEHGVIVDPVRGEEFVGSRGAGAQLNGKRIRVTTRAKLSECVLGTGIPPGSMNLLPDYSRTLGNPYRHVSRHPTWRQRRIGFGLCRLRSYGRFLGSRIEQVGYCRGHRVGS
jgi:myo-inositol-1(or 4)-monophosphatase